VEFDRQAIEKRDFPIVRRGYEPAAVDAHLRALAAEIEDLQRATSGGGPEASLASTAGTQVQSILQAAETAAADIERQARESASNAREDADEDATRTRNEAVAQAQAHVAAVAQATSILLERVASMDGQASALTESLAAGASRLAADLAAVETNMGELYDAASGRAAADAPRPDAPTRAPSPPVVPPQTAPPQTAPAAPAAAASRPARPAGSSGKTPAETGAAASGELDSARLVALNMALNGDSRKDAERYLAEHFELIDQQKLVDEVYAAIEG
jgi:hypothetical protein